ncbi:MAG: glutamate 5-kinase [Candidatus Brocadiaceae bacterium]|nr:glutamate 5-kinase [Candidatus Brocadiaceae bacterium]
MQEGQRRAIISRTKRLVVKVGTGVITTREGFLDIPQVNNLSIQLVELRNKGYEVAVVSSGAIGAGMGEFGMKKRPTTLPELQAAAAVGQSKLIRAYDDSFKTHGYHAAQILLTREDLEDRRRYLNTSNTIATLLRMKAIPVINENDTVSVEEIAFTDNDTLAALVTNLLRAELLVMLSSVNGLYKDPAAKEVIPVVEEITEEVEHLAFKSKTYLGTGGMQSKLQAARVATASGEAVIVVNGRTPNILVKIMQGEPLGTLFLPATQRLQSRKRWIGFTLRPRGRIYVDRGASEALARKGKSLLASGITHVEGDFERGDVISLFCDKEEFAKGLSNYSSKELEKIKGQPSSQIAKLLGTKPYDEVVHRDNLVLL